MKSYGRMGAWWKLDLQIPWHVICVLLYWTQANIVWFRFRVGKYKYGKPLHTTKIFIQEFGGVFFLVATITTTRKFPGLII
jgi:hypothetical protein